MKELILTCITVSTLLLSCGKSDGPSGVDERDTTYLTGRIGQLTFAGNLINNNKSSFGDIVVHTSSYQPKNNYVVEINLGGEFMVIPDNSTTYPDKFEARSYRVAMNFVPLEKGVYRVVNPTSFKQPNVRWVYHDIITYHTDGSVNSSKRYVSSSVTNPFKLYVDDVQEDSYSIVPILSGRMSGYLFNELDTQDSVFVDLKFVSKSYDPSLQK